jgi:hypothetical protein
VLHRSILWLCYILVCSFPARSRGPGGFNRSERGERGGGNVPSYNTHPTGLWDTAEYSMLSSRHAAKGGFLCSEVDTVWSGQRCRLLAACIRQPAS